MRKERTSWSKGEVDANRGREVLGLWDRRAEREQVIHIFKSHSKNEDLYSDQNGNVQAIQDRTVIICGLTRKWGGLFTENCYVHMQLCQYEYIKVSVCNFE
jgi:hypothetical protein